MNAKETAERFVDHYEWRDNLNPAQLEFLKLDLEKLLLKFEASTKRVSAAAIIEDFQNFLDELHENYLTD